MGAWGYGPFDSDGALDWLGVTADNAGAQYTPDYDIIPGTVNAERAESAVRAALTDEAAAEADWGWGFDSVYAAAGLVAAVITATPSTGGTSLFAALQGDDVPRLNLEASCGYNALLTADQARFLAPFALNTLNKVLQRAENNETVLAEYPELHEGVEALRDVIAEALQTA